MKQSNSYKLLGIKDCEYFNRRLAMYQLEKTYCPQNDLIAAVWYGKLDTVKELLSSGIDINLKDCNGNTALMTAAAIGHSPIFHFLLEQGAKVNISSQKGFTALLWAVLANDKEYVKIIIEKGADLNVKENEYGYNALEWALSEKLYGVVRLLLEYGADYHDCNKNCKFRLMKNASRLGFPVIAEELKESCSLHQLQ